MSNPSLFLVTIFLINQVSHVNRTSRSSTCHTKDFIYELSTTRIWDYLGLSTGNSKSLIQKYNMGKQVIVGVIDSGVWRESEMFFDKGNGSIPRRWKGGCVSGELFNGSIHCNRKLIGAKYFVDGFIAAVGDFNKTENPEYIFPRDFSGHGTHVASTIGGYFVHNGQAIFPGPGLGFVGLAYPPSGDCGQLSANPNNTMKGKVVLCFTTDPIPNSPVVINALTAVRNAGGLGVIIARNPTHLLRPATNIPCVTVDFQLRTGILFYIRSTRSPIVKIQASRTLIGKPVETKVATFSSRGPNSVPPAILKVFKLLKFSVTNVGPLNSRYKVVIDPPIGINVVVTPTELVFNSTTRKLSFIVRPVSTRHKVNTGYNFGSLTWTDNLHNVAIPVSVRPQILERYHDEN